MDKASPAYTPLPAKTILTSSQCPQTDEQRAKVKHLPYCTLVGKVMYLATTSRPDIAFAIRELAKFMTNYGQAHWDAATYLLRYLKGTRTCSLTLGHLDHPYPLFRGFTDSDWGMGEHRKSISGYVMMMGNSPICWSSKQQAVVALSSCEAEYLACTHAACQIIWLRQLLEKLDYAQPAATPLFCDNNGTVSCTHDPHNHTRMKHTGSPIGSYPVPGMSAPCIIVYIGSYPVPVVLINT